MSPPGHESIIILLFTRLLIILVPVGIRERGISRWSSRRRRRRFVATPPRKGEAVLALCLLEGLRVGDDAFGACIGFGPEFGDVVGGAHLAGRDVAGVCFVLLVVCMGT